MCGTGPFLGGSGRRAVAHTRPAFPKMPMAPSAFPLLGAPQAPGNEPNPPRKGVKAWGEGPLRLKEISRHRDTLGQIRAADNTAGRSATRHLERCQTEIDLPIFVAASHQTRLDTRSKARRPIKVGINGRGSRERAETRTLMVNAAHQLT